jgi:hypothetical protein
VHVLLMQLIAFTAVLRTADSSIQYNIEVHFINIHLACISLQHAI